METPEQDRPEFDWASLWARSATQLLQAVFLKPPDLSPGALRQARAVLFQSYATAWEDYLKSPAFLEWMRQSMTHTVALRRMTTDWLGRVRTELQAPSRQDVETVLQTLQHLEKRLLDRINEFGAELQMPNGHSAKPPGAAKQRPRNLRRARSAATTKS